MSEALDEFEGPVSEARAEAVAKIEEALKTLTHVAQKFGVTRVMYVFTDGAIFHNGHVQTTPQATYTTAVLVKAVQEELAGFQGVDPTEPFGPAYDTSEVN